MKSGLFSLLFAVSGYAEKFPVIVGFSTGGYRIRPYGIYDKYSEHKIITHYELRITHYALRIDYVFLQFVPVKYFKRRINVIITVVLTVEVVAVFP